MSIKFYLEGSYCLDSYSPHQVEFSGKFYPTAEHLYQALKFEDLELHENIRCAISPHFAKAISHENKDQFKPG